MAAGESPKSREEVRLDYAWGWFQYHASQRFSAFNFFVVVVGALTVAYASASTNHSRTLGAAVALLGAFMAVGFTVIDFRNEQLVDCGRVELKAVEPGFGVSITEKAELCRRHYASHRMWLRLMIVGFGLASLAAAFWAIASTHFGN